jgi:o-succinylbenzoate---CoA ligase
MLVEPMPWPGGVARAAVAWDPSPRLLSLVFGALEAGAQIALLNTRLTEAERQGQLAALGLRKNVNAVHFLDADVNTVHFPEGEVNIVHVAEPDVNGVHIEKNRGDGDPATLLFTSGTTGAPKAAILPLASHLANARAANEVLGIDASSRFLCAMPLFHVGGLGIAFRCATAGATLLLHQRFDAAAVAGELQKGATHASLVPSTLARVLDSGAQFPPTVRAVLIGGGPVPKHLLERARRAGLPVLQTYGLTETCSMATCERPGEADGTTAGPAMPGLSVKIEQGEILVQGPQLMRGYEGQPRLRGFFHTGDLGDLDSGGRLTIHARRTDLIVSGGENIYPAEVEAALLTHPAVREAAVVPAADARWGQVGVAYVVTTAAEGELREHLQSRLARYKIPARFEAVPELPRTASGKVDRQKLSRR